MMSGVRARFDSSRILKELSKPNQRRRYSLAVLALFLFALLVFRFYDQYLEIQATPIHSWAVDQSADCGAVLTGGAGRVKEGMDLLARRSIRKLIVSGVNPQAEWREVFPNWPFYQDVQESDIILERRSRTTFGNAQQALAVAEALGCQDLLIITSQVHLPRALRTFRAESGGRLHIEGRAVPAASGDSNFLEVGVEVLKAIFYGLWAY